jgi:hypothetical protein
MKKSTIYWSIGGLLAFFGVRYLIKKNRLNSIPANIGDSIKIKYIGQTKVLSPQVTLTKGGKYIGRLKDNLSVSFLYGIISKPYEGSGIKQIEVTRSLYYNIPVSDYEFIMNKNQNLSEMSWEERDAYYAEFPETRPQ